MMAPWPFHTWGLDLIGLINLTSKGHIWIIVVTEYFTKWVEAITLKKATGPTVADFIRKHIICRFHSKAHNLQIWHPSQDCYW